MSKRASIVWFLIVLTSTMLHAQTRIDGNWWKEANPETRRGLVLGASDCLHANHGAKLTGLTVPVLVGKVDAAFAEGSANKTLASVLMGLPKESGPGAPGGEDYSKEKHGWFDGYYWGSASADESFGFLVGYLSCGDRLPISETSVHRYEKDINSWYDKHPSSNAAIADVLAKVRVRRTKS